MNPINDGLGSLGDGGYRPEDFGFQAETSQADAIIRQRIIDLQKSYGKLNDGLADWFKKNQAAAQKGIELALHSLSPTISPKPVRITC